MTDLDDPTPAARLSDAYALWSESGGTRSDQWIALLSDNIEMRSVLTPDLPDDLAAHRRSLGDRDVVALGHRSQLERAAPLPADPQPAAEHQTDRARAGGHCGEAGRVGRHPEIEAVAAPVRLEGRLDRCVAVVHGDPPAPETVDGQLVVERRGDAADSCRQGEQHEASGKLRILVSHVPERCASAIHRANPSRES